MTEGLSTAPGHIVGMPLFKYRDKVFTVYIFVPTTNTQSDIHTKNIKYVKLNLMTHIET